MERFWSKVNKTDGCWEWTASLYPEGYGQFWYHGRRQGAHCVAWQLARGAIPDRLFVCHHCDNPKCVRPDHLFLGTHADNMKDMTAKGHHRGGGPAIGERNGSTKLTQEKVDEIRTLYPELNQMQLARMFGVGRSQIQRIVTNQNWKE